MLKKAEFIGNIGQEAVLRNTKDGRKFITVSLAANEIGRQDADPMWINLIFFNGLATEKNVAYLNAQNLEGKRRMLYVSGELQMDTFEKEMDVTVPAKKYNLKHKGESIGFTAPERVVKVKVPAQSLSLIIRDFRFLDKTEAVATTTTATIIEDDEVEVIEASVSTDVPETETTTVENPKVADSPF